MKPLFATVVVAASLAGCGGGKADECQRYADKAWPVFDKLLSSMPGAKGPRPTKGQLVAACRASPRRDASMDCVLAAADRTAVEACLASAFTDYMSRGHSSEIRLRANMLAKATKAALALNAAYPVARTSWVPASSCCGQPDHKCAPEPQQWAAPPFAELDFALDEPSAIRVKYEGTAEAYTAVLWSDDDCDDEQDASEVVTVRGTIEAGNPVVSID